MNISSKSELISFLQKEPHKRLLCTADNHDDTGFHWVVREMPETITLQNANGQLANVARVPIIGRVAEAVAEAMIADVAQNNETAELEQSLWCSTYVLKM